MPSVDPCPAPATPDDSPIVIQRGNCFSAINDLDDRLGLLYRRLAVVMLPETVGEEDDACEAAPPEAHSDVYNEFQALTLHINQINAQLAYIMSRLEI
jgi:hypothetical protein